ncbi:YdcH family protein [Pseudomonas sp. 15FMM2]|uniref:YdcH family protein n=1 Tax=Pseudomonas imrae TaxID=2992837 RepID=A0ACC7PBL9_9PSED
MPVKHDLYLDLRLLKEDVQQRRAGNKHLDALLTQYDDVDKEVLKAEHAKASDEDVENMKKKRLLIKDKIADLLSLPPH